MLVDTHAHLFWDSFKEDLDEVIKRSIDSGVTTIINVGTSLETSQIALNQIKDLEEKGLTTYSSIGIHPHDAYKHTDTQKLKEDIDKLEKIYISNPKNVIAVGECGLDFNFANPDYIPSSLSIDKLKDLQKKLFLSQIKLAQKLNLPLLIHCRDAWSEIFEFIKDERGILHCFSGDLEIVEKALKTDFLISFPATITYPKNEILRNSLT